MPVPNNLHILVVAPFTHQNGHYVTFPRDLSCALAAAGNKVTLLHTRPFRVELDEFGHSIQHVCLFEQLESAPRWWRELWPRLSSRPSNLCLVWMIWRIKPTDYDLVLWSDLQAHSNLWSLAAARLLGLYRFKSAFFKHHRPPKESGPIRLFRKLARLERLRFAGLKMFVFSKALLKEWAAHIGRDDIAMYVPWGVWPTPLTDDDRRKARSELGMNEDARALLVFGAQAVKRKHLDTLQEALTGFTPKYPLLLLFVGASTAGEPHPFKNWQPSVNNIEIRFEEGFVSEERVHMYFAAADRVWANYRNFPGASGVLLQAMGFGRLVIASNEGEIASLCKEHDLGQIVGASKPDDLRRILNDFVEMPRDQQWEWEQSTVAAAEQYSWPKVMRQVFDKLGYI